MQFNTKKNPPKQTTQLKAAQVISSSKHWSKVKADNGLESKARMQRNLRITGLNELSFCYQLPWWLLHFLSVSTDSLGKSKDWT